MRSTAISNTDLVVSSLCLGTAHLGSEIPRPIAFQMLDAYLEAGGNFVDTAKVYADWLPGERSTSEKTIGEWMRTRGNRSRVVLATKGAHPDLQTMHIPRLSREEIVADLDASLRHLQTDLVDLYWLHRDDPARPVEEILETLNDQAQAGKIRYFGCSNWRTPRIAAAQEYAAEHHLRGFVANQVLWNVGVPDMQAVADKTVAAMDAAMREYHAEIGMAAISYTSQANGFFNRMAAGTRDRMKPELRAVYDTPDNRERFRRIQTVCSETGLSVTQVVLGFLISQPFPTIPIVGPQNLTQLADSLSAADVLLTREQVAYLDQGDGPETMADNTEYEIRNTE